MRKNKIMLWCAQMALIIITPLAIQAQNVQEYTNLSSFKTPAQNWHAFADVDADLQKDGVLHTKNGNGVIVNQPTKKASDNLISVAEYGDVDISLEFMMAKHSHSNIYLQGRYGLQLSDSWGVKNPSFSDCGGIQPSNERSAIFNGLAPRTNAFTAPGLWQKLIIRFSAPRFDAAGKKTKNALLLSVELNGVIIHDNIELTGPTAGALFKEEAAHGPLVFTGEQPVAFRNIHIIDKEKNTEEPPRDKVRDAMKMTPAYYIKANHETVIQRIFREYDNKVLTYIASVGSPQGVHYSLNTFNGALMESWRGEFLDASLMWVWKGRGICIAEPMGAIIKQGNEKAFAIGDNARQWGDTISATDNYHFLGYDVDKQNRPLFRYTVGGVHIEDRILPVEDKYLSRSLHFTDPLPADFYHRVATGSAISKVSKDLYLIDKAFWVKLPPKSKVTIQSQGDKQLLLVLLTGDIQYDIIW